MEKLQVLSQASEMDAGESGCLQRAQIEKSDGIVLTRSTMREGKPTILLKSLLTSFCENNCLYCPFRSGRDFPRASFTPDEFANLAVNLTRAGLIQGVFLSSGIAGSAQRFRRAVERSTVWHGRARRRSFADSCRLPGPFELYHRLRLRRSGRSVLLCRRLLVPFQRGRRSCQR